MPIRTKEHNIKIGLSNLGRKVSKETRIKISNSLKGHETSEETREKHRINATGKIFSKETRKKLSEISKRKIFTPEYRKKISDSKKGITSPMKGKKHKEESKLKMSITRKGKYTGVNSSNWQGGISFEPYSIDWTKTLKISIRERDEYRCKICGKPQGDIAHPVHHIDYNKKNCDPQNLITLCTSCHLKTNYHREYWQQYFKK